MSAQALDIVWLLFSVFGLAIATLAVRRLNDYMQQRLTRDQYDYMLMLIAQLVDAAEQQYKAGSLSGENRLLWVKEQLIDRLPGVPSKVINPLIQAQVRRVNLENERTGLTKPTIVATRKS